MHGNRSLVIAGLVENLWHLAGRFRRRWRASSVDNARVEKITVMRLLIVNYSYYEPVLGWTLRLVVKNFAKCRVSEGQIVLRNLKDCLKVPLLLQFDLVFSVIGDAGLLLFFRFFCNSF